MIAKAAFALLVAMLASGAAADDAGELHDHVEVAP